MIAGSPKANRKIAVDITWGTHAPYVDLIHASRCVLEAGGADPKGSSWQFLSSIVLTAFAVEAYLNHRGQELWDLGRLKVATWEKFVWMGPRDKLKHLMKVLDVSFPGHWDAAPLKTLNTLLINRDALAHGKTQRSMAAPIRQTIDPAQVDEILRIDQRVEWRQLTQNGDFAVAALGDVERVMAALHAAEPSNCYPLLAGPVTASGVALVMQPAPAIRAKRTSRQEGQKS